MDPVEQTDAQAEQEPADVVVADVVVADVVPAEVIPVKEEESTQEPVHFVCANCGYHDVNGGPPSRCPACYFRHASEPVHQAPVKEPETAKKELEPAKEAEVTEAEVTEAQEKAKAPVQAEEPLRESTGAAEDEDAEHTAHLADGQAVHIVETVVIVEKAPAGQSAQDLVQDAGKAVEEQG